MRIRKKALLVFKVYGLYWAVHQDLKDDDCFAVSLPDGRLLCDGLASIQGARLGGNMLLTKMGKKKTINAFKKLKHEN